jgi:hypothetical protein
LQVSIHTYCHTACIGQISSMGTGWLRPTNGSPLAWSHLFRFRHLHSTNATPKVSSTSTMLTHWNKLDLPGKAMRTFAKGSYPSKVIATPRTFATTCSTSQHTSDTDQIPYWRNLSPWKDVHADEFLNYGWQVSSVYGSLFPTRLTFDIRKRIRSSGQTSS